MLTGEMIVGAERVRGQEAFHAIDPRTGRRLEPAFYGGGPDEVDRACRLAERASEELQAVPAERRALFLEEIAARVEQIGEALIARAHEETGLPVPRLQGERARTTGQLRLFAQTLRAGRWQGAVLDRALPDRSPPRPDLRAQRIPVGPVAVFGASNFPLAFSVAGGDTAAALAAGCPVVVKAHPAHPGTSELVGVAVREAAAHAGMPDGVFSLLFGRGNELGGALVAHPAIQAVGFTGSRAGGLALMRIAAGRPQPIPVYAEMSSINPVLLLPAALEARATRIAADLIDSLVLGAGQFCTNPGLVVAIEGPALQAFRDAAGAALHARAAGLMLTPAICQAYRDGEAARAGNRGMRRLAEGLPAQGDNEAVAALYEARASDFLTDPAMHDEVFGPSSLLVACRGEEDMLAVARGVEGQLTFTLHADARDAALAGRLLRIAERKAGRVLFNGFPTGVEVCHAMVHGGPFPATSDTRSTSVGTMAMERFLRPVCYQNVPAELLPEALRDGNPLGLWRLVDGDLQRG